MGYHALTMDEIAHFIHYNRHFPFWMSLRRFAQEVYGLQACTAVVAYETEASAEYHRIRHIRGIWDVRVYTESGEQMKMDRDSPHLAAYFQEYAQYYPGVTPHTASPDNLLEARIAIKDRILDDFPPHDGDIVDEEHPEVTYDLRVPPPLTIAELFVR